MKTKQIKIGCCLVVFLLAACSGAPGGKTSDKEMDAVFFEMPLYSGKIPNLKDVPDGEIRSFDPQVDSLSSNVSRPTLKVFLPADTVRNRAAVIVCPGGGYHTLLTVREGSRVAQRFNEEGVAGFVLKYRHPNDANLEDKTIAPLQDAQRAIQIVREHAAEWGIDPNQIGIMGFSAGGHVAATAGTHYDDPVIDNPQGTSLRPDFMLLIYPVISCRDGITHGGSRQMLLGATPTEEQIKRFSNEEQVSSTTPPTYLTHANDDTVVPIENSLLFYQALRRNGIPAELHIYSKGEHGYLQEPSYEEWMDDCVQWMARNGWIK